jgi:DNA-directed RNA polymerase subunit B
MTVGQAYELAWGKICARRGITVDGTPMRKTSTDEIAQELVKEGYRYNGRERMYNGITGDCFDTAIFIGPIFQQRLQKFVLDDEYAVAGTGPIDPTTGQPLGGKNTHGGLRLGEMELWNLIGHGCMNNIFEKLNRDSCGCIEYICRRCGTQAVFNKQYEIEKCRICGPLADICPVHTRRSAVAFRNEMASVNVRLTLGLAPRQFETAPAAPAGTAGSAGALATTTKKGGDVTANFEESSADFEESSVDVVNPYDLTSPEDIYDD